jgi:Zn-dependent peptidase ImmA (M78 family)/DNA-binding XRE family transcriptional regulator
VIEMISKAIIGERIKAARKMAGLSQQVLADKVAVSKMAISKYETGAVIPGSGMLIALGKVLGVKVEYFLRPVSVTLQAPQYRRRKALPKREEARILARTQEWLERYLTIERILGEEPHLDLPDENKCRIKSPDDIENLVLKIRRDWSLGLDPTENVMDVLEQHGIKVGVLDASEQFDAFTLWYNEHPIIVVNNNMTGDRQRFSLAHELGHLLMQIEPEFGTAIGVDSRITPADRTEQDSGEWSVAEEHQLSEEISEDLQEIAANRFAGAFLVPRDNVINELGPGRTRLEFRELRILKQKYGLSMAAWIYRAKDCGIISDEAKARHFKELNARGWRKREPGEIPPESPTRMKLLLLHALSEKIITESRYLELAGDDERVSNDGEMDFEPVSSAKMNNGTGEMCE